MNTAIIREEMKQEAIRRMKSLDLYENVIQEFIRAGKLNKSERSRLTPNCVVGALYWLDDAEIKMVKAIEQEKDILVYHMTHEYFTWGETYSLLYVSKHIEEWEMDRDDLQEGYVMSYVYNKTDPDMSEFGGIQVKNSGGGLIRIA